jgi:hypothetical protein
MWGRLLSMSAAGSGRSRQMPRGGDQGRSRHATSCTGCAKHSARDDQNEITQRCLVDVARILLIHWAIC